MKAHLNIFLIFILSVSIFGCSPVSVKPKTKPDIVQYVEPELLKSMAIKTFETQNAKGLSYGDISPMIYNGKLRYNTSSEDKLARDSIETGRPVLVFDNNDVNSMSCYLFGEKIVDLETGEIKMDCMKEINTVCSRELTDIVDSRTAVIFDSRNSGLSIIDYKKGRILQKITSLGFADFSEAKRIYTKGDVYVYTLKLCWGHGDATPDMGYFGSEQYHGLVAINVRKGTLVLAALQPYSYKLVNDKLVFHSGENITCFDLIKQKKIWDIKTNNNERYYRNVIYGVYKSNIIVPLSNGIASIDSATGNMNWVYETGDTEYWTNRGRIEANILEVEIHIGRYLYNARENYGRDLVNYHRYYDCTLDLNTGKLLDKQLVKDDTGKNEIIVDINKRYNDINISIKQYLSKSDQNQSHSTITFSNSETVQTFEFSGEKTMAITVLDLNKTAAMCIGYRSFDRIFDIRKEDNKYLVYGGLDINPNPSYILEFSEGKDVNRVEIPDNICMKYHIGEDILEIGTDYVSKIADDTLAWKDDNVFCCKTDIPFFDGENIILSGNNGITIINSVTGKNEQLSKFILLGEYDDSEIKTAEYLAKIEDSVFTVFKLKKSATMLDILQ